VSQTESDDTFGNTFYSEISFIDANASAVAADDKPAEKIPPLVFHSQNPDCEITIDVAGAPELKEWAETKLGPTLAEWYPKIVAMLPSDGFTPPKSFSVTIRPGRGVAATGRTRVTANSTWLKGQLNGEAVGAIVHEEVHVVQQYGYEQSNPGWLVEGIADYVRWWFYEPDGPRRYRFQNPRYDGAYTVTANFLHWVADKYDKDIVVQMNAALRQHQYSADLWKKYTGKDLETLGAEWKAQLPPSTTQPTRRRGAATRSAGQ
jgi:hypothetical protein